MGSQPVDGENKQPVFGLLRNFTGNDPSSSVERISLPGRQDCGVDRKLSGVTTSTEEQHIHA